jgi:glycerol-3-phosphate responsive antiterminator
MLLKKDMIEKLKNKHKGEQFIDDVMETFGIPTNFMEKINKRK